MSCSCDRTTSQRGIFSAFVIVLSTTSGRLWCIFSMHRCSLPYAWPGWSLLLSIKCGRTRTAAFCSPRLFRCCDTLPQNKNPTASKKERAGRDESEGEGEDDCVSASKQIYSVMFSVLFNRVGSFPKVPSDVSNSVIIISLFLWTSN